MLVEVKGPCSLDPFHKGVRPWWTAGASPPGVLGAEAQRGVGVVNTSARDRWGKDTRGGRVVNGSPWGSSLLKALLRPQHTSLHPRAQPYRDPGSAGPPLRLPPLTRPGAGEPRHRAGRQSPRHSLHRVVAGEGDEAPKGQ